jgi:hypothetical protein
MNMMVTPDNTLKLIDFGIAAIDNDQRKRADESDGEEEELARSLGTESYMDPEFADSGEFCAECDTYSLGVTLFKAMTGRVPFNNPYAASRTDSIPYIGGYSDSLVSLGKRMLNPKIKDRIKMVDVITELKPQVAAIPGSTRATVEFKREGSTKSEMVRFNTGTTVGQFIQAVEKPTGRALCAKLQDRVLDENELIADSARRGEVVIAAAPTLPSDGGPTRVRYRYEGRLCLTRLPSSATITDLLGRVAPGLKKPLCVKVDGMPVAGADRVADWADEVLDVCPDDPVSDVRSGGRSCVRQEELDLVFVVDATGSMAPSIEAAHDKAYEFAEAFRLRDRTLKLQIGCVCYRDPVDCPEDGPPECHAFNANVFGFKDFLGTVRATGGGDGPEDWAGALESVIALGWRPTARHAIVWIADAPAHGKRYCGRPNHQEEEPRLEPLVRMIARFKCAFLGLSINSGANCTFNEIQKIYQATNRDLLCQYKQFREVVGTHKDKVKTAGEFFSGTIRDLVKSVLPFDPQKRASGSAAGGHDEPLSTPRPAPSSPRRGMTVRFV